MKKFLPIVRCLILATVGLLAEKAHGQAVTFQVSYETNDVSVGDGPTAIWLANLRGLETWRDLVVANSLSNNVTVRYCNDDGTFTDPVEYSTGLTPVAVKTADLNKDGIEDIVTANFGTNNISLLISAAGNTFRTTNYTVGTSGTPQPSGIEFLDTNRDGKKDIAVANYNDNNVTILVNLGSAVFHTSSNYNVGNGPRSLVARDFNRDGYTDIVTANQIDGTLTVLRGLSTGFFASNQTITLFSGGDPQPFDVIAADFNNDKLLDLATANYNSNSVSILLQQTNGTFLMATNYDVGTNPRSLVTRDLNRDGNADFVVANENSDDIYIFLGLGDGSFTNSTNYSTGGSPMAVAGSNFNEDQQNDLVVANYDDDTVRFYLYNAPLASSFTVTMLEDSTNKPVTLRGQVLHSTPSSYTLLSSPTHGTLDGTIPNYTYTPGTNYYGSDHLTYRCSNGGIDSGIATVTLTILPVNDAPFFNLRTNQVTALKLNASQTVTSFATNINVGVTNESLQALLFVVTNNNHALFSTQPAISTNGTLTFKSARTNGSATVSVRLKDSGTFSNGGTNQSAEQTFTITVPTNLFTTITGNYQGLFFETNEVRHTSSGYFNFLLKDLGLYTGKMLIEGGTYYFSGQFNLDGTINFSVPRSGKPTLTVAMALDLTTNATDRVTGSVSNSTDHWNAELAGDRALTVVTDPAPGLYTMAFVGTSDGSTSPGGDGMGLVTVKASGTLVFNGTLSDNTTVSQTTYISKYRQWPFYLPLYSGRGSVINWITFSNRIESSIENSGPVTWIKTNATTGFYRNGFTNELTLIGSTLTSLTNAVRALDLTNGYSILSGGDLTTSLTNTFLLPTNNIIQMTSTNNRVTLTLNRSNGIVTGTFTHPITHRTAQTIRGVIIQQENRARGFFVSTNLTGGLLLQPQE